MKPNGLAALIEQMHMVAVGQKPHRLALADAGGFDMVPNDRRAIFAWVSKVHVHAASEPFDELDLELQSGAVVAWTPMFRPDTKGHWLARQLLGRNRKGNLFASG